MIVKKPRNIDFLATKVSLEKQIEALMNLQKGLLNEELELKAISKLNKQQLIQLSYVQLDLETITADIKIKQEVFQEYLERTMMQAQIDKMNAEDYKRNNQAVINAAKMLKSDFSVSKELKNHLKEVLSVDTTKFNTEQKISFFLALKKEVEICRTYRKNSLK